MRFELVDQIILPRHDNGIDFGATRRLLAMKKDNSALLYIRNGHSASAAGVRGFGQEYRPASLQLKLNNDVKDAYYIGFEIAEGRISKSKLLLELANEIERAFNIMDFVDQIDMKKTLIVNY